MGRNGPPFFSPQKTKCGSPFLSNSWFPWKRDLTYLYLLTPPVIVGVDSLDCTHGGFLLPSPAPQWPPLWGDMGPRGPPPALMPLIPRPLRLQFAPTSFPPPLSAGRRLFPPLLLISFWPFFFSLLFLSVFSPFWAPPVWAKKPRRPGMNFCGAAYPFCRILFGSPWPERPGSNGRPGNPPPHGLSFSLFLAFFPCLFCECHSPKTLPARTSH